MIIPWIDVETTGLDAHNDLLLEVGIVLTDGFLGECAQLATFSIGVLPPQGVRAAREQASDFIRDMHDRSHLWNWLGHGGNAIPREQLDAQLCEIASIWLPDKPPLANFNAPFDRRWLAVWAPRFVEECLHYRCFDVSTLRATVEAVWPSGFGPTCNTADTHRAALDARDAVKYWRWYRANALNPHGRTSPSAATVRHDQSTAAL